MADVTGNIGGQPVELNNAATEATLKQLVKAIGILAAKQGSGGGAKSQKELEKELKKFQQAVENTGNETKKLTKKQKEAQDAADQNTKRTEEEAEAKRKAAYVTEKVATGFVNLTNKTMEYAGKLVSVINDVANMGNSMSSAAQLFSHIPIAGGILSSSFGAVAGQSEKLLKSFQTASSVGAGFGGSIVEMTNAASAAGMTVDQFGQLLASNGEKIALLGKGSTDGARQFAKFTKELRTSGAAAELARMGYSTEQINSGMAGFAARLQQTGKLQGMTTQQVAASTAAYLKDLDAVARLTGKNREAMQKEEEQRMKDAQYMAFKRKLDAQGQKELEMIMQSLPAELQEGAKEVLATGTATSDAGVAFLAYMNKSGQNLAQLGIQARKTGTIQAGSAARVANMVQDEAKSLANSGLGDTLATFGDDAQKRFMAGAYDAAARQGKLDEIQKQQQQEAEERKKKEAELKAKGLDPAAMVGFQEKIAAISNQFSILIAQHMPTLMSAFDKLIKFVNDFLVPAFKFFMDNIKLIVGGFVALKVAMAAYQAYLKIKEFKEGLKGTIANPMITKDISGGGGGLGDLGGKGGKAGGKGLGKIGGAAKLLGKAAGPLGAALAVGSAAMDYSEISDQEKRGEITKEEASKKKGGVVGEGVGGAGGALAGAAAGAAIGSVVPIIGTAIGGLIGAAVGGWGGGFLGKKAGEAVMSTPGKPVSATPVGNPATSASAAAATKVAELEKQKAEMDKQTSEQQQQLQAMLGTGTTTKVTQEQLNKTMEQLNNNTAQMVKLMKNQTTISERQLDVTKGLGSGDIFVTA